MVDPRFFALSRPHTAGELAAFVGAQVHGDASKPVRDVAPLREAGEGALAFLDNRKYLADFKHSSASVCVVRQTDVVHAPAGMTLLIHATPYAAYARMAGMLFPTSLRPVFIEQGVHSNARVAASAKIATSASVGAGAEIDEDVILQPYAVIGAGVVIGKGSVVGAGAVITHTMIGQGCIIHSGASIGQDGFGFAPSEKGLLKVPQLGRVVIGDQVEIGANTTIDRGTNGDTVIGDGTKIDNLVQIGHNVRVGRSCVIVAQTGISGSTVLGDGVMLGGQSGIAGHVQIGDRAQCAAQSGVHADVAAGVVVGGSPAVPIRQWHRQTIALAKIVSKQ